MNDHDLLDLATEVFRDRLAAVGPDQWDLPTPCADWTVRDLVAHVLGGNAMVVVLADGASTEEGLAAFTGATLDDDVVAQFTAGAAEQSAVFSRAGAGEQTFHHPAGDMPGQMVLGFRIGDLAIHAWDLARATGGDEHLPEELVAAVLATLLPMAPVIGSIGVFGEGPSLSDDADATLQDRMLDLAGRRP